MLRMKDFTQDKIVLDDIIVYLIFFNDFNPNNYLHLLSEIEQSRLKGFGHISRKREFVATRILKHHLFGYKKIEYTAHGAPYIKGEGYISISHSKGCCAIALCEEFKIGLDLEGQSNKAQMLFHKFLNEHELTFLKTHDEQLMTAAWSCKESLYKLAGRKQLIFKEDLLLLNKNKNNWKAKICNPDATIYVNLTTIVKDKLIITINTSPIESIAT